MSAEKPSAEDRSYCAHLTVKWCTEPVQQFVEATADMPGGMRTMTRGWWECVMCHTAFAPLAALSDARREALEDAAGLALGNVTPSHEFPQGNWRNGYARGREEAAEAIRRRMAEGEGK